MPKYSVEVEYKMKRAISVFADDESEAEDKAVQVVLKWKDVVDAEAIDVTEE